ncbi:MAG: OmpA family protein [Parvularculaceae bacterium]
MRASYTGAGGYTNWELSADRASVARRLLVEYGLPADQVVGVVGRAATEPLSDDPFAAAETGVSPCCCARRARRSERTRCDTQLLRFPKHNQ